ncbi:MAG: dihydroorotate dehydrogenase [Chloroflexi bacterium RBG_16_50_9]|nr:MAG: dihydroorotate dehydrogenase [Chloroflexi bacterium RBG_16_50_9]
MKQIVAPVISNVEVMPETYLIWLECPDVAAEARPGQFVMVNCGEDCYLPRPLSIHRTDVGKLALLFKIVGKGTEWLSQQKTGNTLNIFGPLGNGFYINPDAHNLLLVAGGIGIAPIRFLADAANKQSKNITLLMGAQQAVQHLSNELLPSPMKLVISTDDGSMGKKGPATLSIPNEANRADQVFACGPVGMYRAMAQMPELKNKPVQVSLEIRMACGVGVCYSCTIKTRKGLKQVCKDGPVFELEDIIWEGMGGV